MVFLSLIRPLCEDRTHLVFQLEKNYNFSVQESQEGFHNIAASHHSTTQHHITAQHNITSQHNITAQHFVLRFFFQISILLIDEFQDSLMSNGISESYKTTV
jgi:hypothetical protein